MVVNDSSKIIIFDTTLRDGEMMPGVQFELHQKIALSQFLEAIGVDIIEVGYPGIYDRDFEAVSTLTKYITKSVICGLAGSTAQEIVSLGKALRSADRGRINIYTTVNLKTKSKIDQSETLNVIRESITLAMNDGSDIQWSAFDAFRGDLDFVCQAVETAIKAGAKTICIPDSLGTAEPEAFADFVGTIASRVPNSDRAIFAVHCHDDRGLAVENSMATLATGVRQIECSINGLGARKGNANLAKIIEAISSTSEYHTDVQPEPFGQISELVAGWFASLI